ncbi:MAG: hypothetical protein LBU37_12570 [Tannerellaceae bacterium]|jgi:hypothetical protein|nr:hypothetical protein [Tannerellaceae bacterium]
MALRDQPYLPLYVQDFLTDEKLAYCSAAATGVYIRIMCLMHKSEEYGKILLKQKFKQSGNQIKNFASQLAVQMPYDFNTLTDALEELIDSRVLSEEPDVLIQKRMVKDNEISELRALSGKKGGLKSLGKKVKNKPKNKGDFALNFAQAKIQANTEYEYEYENKEEEKEKGDIGEKEKALLNFEEEIRKREQAQSGYEPKMRPNEFPKGYEKFDLGFINPAFEGCMLEWLRYKSGKKQKYKTQKSLELCYKQMLAKSGGSPETAMQMIEQSMGNNWDGLFELKQETDRDGTCKQTDSAKRRELETDREFAEYAAKAFGVGSPGD